MLHYTKTLLYTAAINTSHISANQNSTFLNPVQVKSSTGTENSRTRIYSLCF